MAGQPGNTNAIRHGLTVGTLPAGCTYVTRAIAELRRALEQTVLNLRGEISLFDAATIQTTLRWERHAILAQRWLRKEKETLSADRKVFFSREIARASAERDKCLKDLGLDRRATNDSQAGAIVYVPPAATPQDAITSQEGATDEPGR